MTDTSGIHASTAHAHQGLPETVLEVSNLGVEFWVEGEFYPAAVDMNYVVRRGEVLAIVGESGSGKSTSSMSLLGLLPENSRVTGSIKLLGRELRGVDESELRALRGNEISVIFQEPMTALNPVYTIGFQISEALRSHDRAIAPSAAKERAIELLRMVEMPNPEQSFNKYPHQLSGGQRQRAMIAQSISCDPLLLIADEPTTALDVTVQAEILDLLRNLHKRLDSAIILITHDMGVVADIADRIMVMKNGVVVESGTVGEIFHDPKHPYTRQLLASVPHLGLGVLEDADTSEGEEVRTDTSAVPVVSAIRERATEVEPSQAGLDPVGICAAAPVALDELGLDAQCLADRGNLVADHPGFRVETVGENKSHDGGNRQGSTEVAQEHPAPVSKDAAGIHPGASVEKGQWGQHEHPGEQVEPHQIKHAEPDRKQQCADQRAAGLYADGNGEYRRQCQDGPGHKGPDEDIPGGHVYF